MYVFRADDDDDDGWRRQCTTWYRKLAKPNHKCLCVCVCGSRVSWVNCRVVREKKGKITNAHALSSHSCDHFSLLLCWTDYGRRDSFCSRFRRENFLFRFIHTRVLLLPLPLLLLLLLLLFDAHVDLDRPPNYHYYCLPQQIKSDYVTSMRITNEQHRRRQW